MDDYLCTNGDAGAHGAFRRLPGFVRRREMASYTKGALGSAVRFRVRARLPIKTVAGYTLHSRLFGCLPGCIDSPTELAAIERPGNRSLGICSCRRQPLTARAV